MLQVLQWSDLLNDKVFQPKLYFLLLGCRPAGRKTEQHDVFAGIAERLADLVPHIQDSWPEAGKIHLDAWREVNAVGGYRVELVPRTIDLPPSKDELKLWFVNLGGYQPGIFEEFHQKLLVVAAHQADAVQQAKQHPFFKTHHLPPFGAAHIDDKWALEVDEVEPLESLLPLTMQQKWSIQLIRDEQLHEDDIHIGYFKLSAL